CRTEGGGPPRYRGASCAAVTQGGERVPGDPWFMAQCWHAGWRAAGALDPAEPEAALGPLEWVAERAVRSGLLPEQLDPFSGAPLSVTPLIWSHAAFVKAVRDYLERRQAFEACPSCGVVRSGRERALL